MNGKLTKAQADAFRAAAKGIMSRAMSEPVRVYLGSGIWWAPSGRYLARQGIRRRLALATPEPTNAGE